MNIFGSIGDTFESISDFFFLLLDPQTYVRIFQVLFGALLVYGAVKNG